MNYSPAGFWIRLIAAIVDGIILGIVNGIIQALFMAAIIGAGRDNGGMAIALTILMIVLMVGAQCYYIGWFYSRKGGTPGKLAFGMKVLNNETGENLTFGRALLRDIVGKMLSALTLLIGFLMVAFRKDKRGLHDLIAGSCVIRS